MGTEAGNEKSAGRLSASVRPQIRTDSQDFRAGFLSGCIAGWHVGWAAAERDMADAWRPVAAYVRSLGSPQSLTIAEAQRRRADTSAARQVPSFEECMTSWASAVADYCRRHRIEAAA